MTSSAAGWAPLLGDLLPNAEPARALGLAVAPLAAAPFPAPVGAVVEAREAAGSVGDGDGGGWRRWK